MNKKIIFLDLDGTLTNDKKQITPRTKESLMKIQREGHTVVLASGRPTAGIKRVADELELDKYHGYILAFNGGKIVDWKTKDTVFQNTMPRMFIKPILEYSKANNLGFITYDNEQIIVGTKMDKYIEQESFINKIPTVQKDVIAYVDYNPNKCLLTAEPDIAEKHEKTLAKMFDKELSVFRSMPYFIEIVSKGIDKAASIEYLINYIGIDRKDTVACGDGFNDLSMIRFAEIGVAMENAQDVIKESANYITKSNNDDGIVEVIEKFF